MSNYDFDRPRRPLWMAPLLGILGAVLFLAVVAILTRPGRHQSENPTLPSHPTAIIATRTPTPATEGWIRQPVTYVSGSDERFAYEVRDLDGGNCATNLPQDIHACRANLVEIRIIESTIGRTTYFANVWRGYNLVSTNPLRFGESAILWIPPDANLVVRHDSPQDYCTTDSPDPGSLPGTPLALTPIP